jgi:hypothetical protein
MGNAQGSRGSTRDEITALVHHPEFQGLPDGQRLDRAALIVQRRQSVAWIQMWKEYPKLRQASMDAFQQRRQQYLNVSPSLQQTQQLLTP